MANYSECDTYLSSSSTTMFGGEYFTYIRPSLPCHDTFKQRYGRRPKAYVHRQAALRLAGDDFPRDRNLSFRWLANAKCPIVESPSYDLPPDENDY